MPERNDECQLVRIFSTPRIRGPVRIAARRRRAPPDPATDPATALKNLANPLPSQCVPGSIDHTVQGAAEEQVAGRWPARRRRSLDVVAGNPGGSAARRRLGIGAERTGAGDGVRTRDMQLGRLPLCQLSYSRSRRASVPEGTLTASRHITAEHCAVAAAAPLNGAGGDTGRPAGVLLRRDARQAVQTGGPGSGAPRGCVVQRAPRAGSPRRQLGTRDGRDRDEGPGASGDCVQAPSGGGRGAASCQPCTGGVRCWLPPECDAVDSWHRVAQGGDWQARGPGSGPLSPRVWRWQEGAAATGRGRVARGADAVRRALGAGKWRVAGATRSRAAGGSAHAWRSRAPGA